MRVVLLTVAIVATTWLPSVISQQHALFVKRDAIESGKRVTRQTSADQMVQNILQWLQGVYTQNSRRIRQGTFREYLPPTNTQKPRPFQPPAEGQGSDNNFIGYPPNGITPQPPFLDHSQSGSNNNNNNGGYPSPGNEIFPPVEHPNFNNGYNYPNNPQPGFPSPSHPEYIPPKTVPTQPPHGFTEATTEHPGSSIGYPTPSTEHPITGYPSTEHPSLSTEHPITGYPGPSTNHPGSTGYPSYSTEHPGPSTEYPESSTGYSRPSTDHPGISTGYPSSEHPSPPTEHPFTGYPTGRPTTLHPGYPESTTHPAPPTEETHPPQTIPTHPPTIPPTHPPTLPPTHPPTVPPTHPPQTYPTHPPQTYPTHPPSTYPPTHPPTLTPSTHPPLTHPTTGHPPFTTATHPPFTQPSTHLPSTHPPQSLETEEPIHPPGQIVQTDSPIHETEQPIHPTEPPIHVTAQPTHPEEVTQPAPGVHTIDDNNVETGDNESTGTDDNEDLKHPPHIHAIEVECAKDMMTINIEFNRKFDGIIYSKGFYNNPECRYVHENSGQTKYSFTVSLNSCGTEFVNAFDTQGQSYLENVLVLQNEAGIQEVWDTIRAVRCLWEGNLNKALSVALSVGMLTQEIVTFSGDTAMAKLDIQLGRGPFAPAANGLVKIGDTMTLVVSVSGDPGFDIQVKDCRAKDSSGENVVALTDDNGCVLKPKLFGAFQKTRNTQHTGASIIAYAFFNAFKFPDVMDLMIECNVELCKTDCEVCSDPNQKHEPGRRRKRDIYNDTIGDPVTMGKTLRVILPEDLSDGEAIINLSQREEICMSTQGFIFSSALLISLLSFSTLFSTYLWLKNQRLVLHKY